MARRFIKTFSVRRRYNVLGALNIFVDYFVLSEENLIPFVFQSRNYNLAKLGIKTLTYSESHATIVETDSQLGAVKPMERKYLRRIADDVLATALEASGAVLIEGPKWCGKTRTAAERAASQLLMKDPDYTESYLKAADAKPSLLLKGETPRLIDEWQMAPVLWDAVRFAVDQRGESGQFILTGSAVPKDNAVQHTGTGRISRLLMRTMTLFESLESSGDISLGALFDGSCGGDGFSVLTIEKLAFALTRGGWPASIGEKGHIALKRVYDYVDAVINIDVSRVDG
ncbi:MAG: AAA family ATPase, partial [Clostridiales bacterium]|nr:AAA family ATPase [Clostridiales bacterium]